MGLATDGEISLSDSEFVKLKTRIYKIAGISLSDAKKTLVVSRLTRLLKQLGLGSFDAYDDYLERAATDDDRQDFVNALTTNLTRFFREDHHFDHLIKHVGGLIDAGLPRVNGRPRLRFWSAGCSTGQEPYTIALCLAAAFPQLLNADFKILATDIDTKVVQKAATGIYTENELAGLSSDRLALFEPAGAGQVRIPARARQLVTFKTLNLMAPWPVKGPFDVIFCRNVTIYFDKPTQRNVFSRFEEVMRPGGCLYIGHSENMGSSGSGFSPMGKTIYRKTGSQEKRSVA